MSTHSETHDGLERVLTGFSSLSRAVSRSNQENSLQVFAFVGLTTSVAAALTAVWVAPIEGEIAYQWIGAWTLAVLGMLLVLRTASSVFSWAAPVVTRLKLAYENQQQDQRLLELAQRDHRLRDEINAIRSRDQTDR